MRNLKKVLALVLVFALSISLFVTTAGAFTDDAEIQNTEAVNACSTLNILGGYEDGSFRPAGNITRAEACKMICVADNGGVLPTLGTEEVPTFTDIAADWCAWARPYIEACASRGIVGGMGNGAFAPSGNVTGAQFAKMLLIELGFNAEIQNYGGTSWEVYVNSDASNRGLYDGISIDPSQPLTRDNAAQMLWNALNAYEVEYKTDLVADNGTLGTKVTLQDRVVGTTQDKITLLEDKYDVKAITGTLIGVTENTDKGTYTITIQDPMYCGYEYNNGDNVSFSNASKDYTSLKCHSVRVLVRESSNGKDDFVFGVYDTDKNSIQTATLKDTKIDGNKVKMDGVKYSLTSDDQMVVVDGSVYAYGYDVIYDFINAYGDGSSSKYTDKAYYQPTSLKLIANDGSSNYSILQVFTYTVAKVSTVGSDYVNLTYKAGNSDTLTSSKCEDSDWNWYDGIAKGDYVLVYNGDLFADGKGQLAKADVVSGKVTATKGNDKLAIDGTWYTMAGNYDKGSMIQRPNANSKVEMVVVDGYVYYTNIITGSIDDVALLVEAATPSGIGKQMEARLIFTDGTDKVVTIEKKWDDKDDGANIIPFYEGTAANPNARDGAPSGSYYDYCEPMLVTYSVSKDVYTLSRLGWEDTTGYDGNRQLNGYDTYVWDDGYVETDGSIKGAMCESTYTTSKEYLSRMYYESTGVVFVKYKDKGGDYADQSDASYKVVTGEQASKYDETLRTMAAIANKSGNSYYGQATFIDLGSKNATGSSDKYAVLLTDVVKDTSDGTKYQLTAWNGTEEISITTTDSAVRYAVAGDIITYTATGDTLSDVEICETGTLSVCEALYVDGYDEGTGDLTLDYAYDDGYGNYEMLDRVGSDDWDSIDSKDTIVLYVDSSNGVGVTEGEINLAYVCDTDFWAKNKLPTTFYKSGKTLVDNSDYTNTMSQDFAPNVKVYVEDTSDDYITVLVVDVNRNVTDW